MNKLEVGSTEFNKHFSLEALMIHMERIIYKSVQPSTNPGQTAQA